MNPATPRIAMAMKSMTAILKQFTNRQSCPRIECLGDDGSRKEKAINHHFRGREKKVLRSFVPLSVLTNPFSLSAFFCRGDFFFVHDLSSIVKMPRFAAEEDFCERGNSKEVYKFLPWPINNGPASVKFPKDDPICTSVFTFWNTRSKNHVSLLFS